MHKKFRIPLIFLTICIIFSSSTGCLKQPAAPILGAPGFALKDASGKIRNLEEFRGNVLLVHFWASWCPPCLEEIPQWVKLAPRYKNLPLKMLAITVDDQLDAALKVLPSSKLGSNLILLWDQGSEIANNYGTHQFPETYLLDKQLNIINKWIGPQDWNSPRARFAIEKSLVH